MESYFSVNIAIIDLDSKHSERILRGKTSKGQKYIRFYRKPEWWENVYFFGKKQTEFYYLRYKLDDIRHSFAEKDCILSMKLKTILAKIGFSGSIQLTEESIDEIETLNKCQIRIYDQRANGGIHIVENLVHGSVMNTELNLLNLVINDRSVIFKASAEYRWLSNDKFLIRNYQCQTSKCSMSFERLDNYKTHVKSCEKGTNVSTKQKILGDNESLLEKTVRLGVLPQKFRNFRQKFFCVFDIETFETLRSEEISPLTKIEGSHKLVSLAVASNLPGYKDKFFCRESSNSESEQKLIDRFVAELENLQALLLENLPVEIIEAVQKIEEKIQSMRFGFEKTELMSLKKFLEQYSVLQIFGFNSGEQK